jgi:hypothetical protein
MDLADWDQKVRPHLQFIEAGAEMAARHARALPCRPEWQTKAQHELETTRKVLESALASIIAAEVIYECKSHAA